jgi:hypothetical protein
VQSTQAEPDPHVVGLLGVHMPIEPPQQEPEPQPPPSQLAVHVPPAHVGVPGPHLTQATPPDPQWLSSVVPGWHMVPSQQPPLQGRPPVQLVPQVCVIGSQASPFMQLAEDLQPASTSAPESPPPDSWPDSRPVS